MKTYYYTTKDGKAPRQLRAESDTHAYLIMPVDAIELRDENDRLVWPSNQIPGVNESEEVQCV